MLKTRLFTEPVLNTIDLTQSDMLGLAWLCEEAAQWRAHNGDRARAKSLRADAALMRSAAVDR